MPTALQITSKLDVTPLLDIHHPQFEKLYRDGVRSSLFKERTGSLVTDCFILENLRSSLAKAGADGQHSHQLQLIGFHLGRLHGAILSSQTGMLRTDVTALVRFQNANAARGYHIGREYYFIDAQPDERTLTDAGLLERLQELQRDSVAFHDEEDTWYYAIGCILGELSGQLFPATSQEYAQWEANRQYWQSEYERTTRQEAITEPLGSVPTVEHTV